MLFAIFMATCTMQRSNCTDRLTGTLAVVQYECCIELLGSLPLKHSGEVYCDIRRPAWLIVLLIYCTQLNQGYKNGLGRQHTQH